MVFCFLHICHRPRTPATTSRIASVSYKLANWAGLTAAFLRLDWPDIFLPSGSQKVWRHFVHNPALGYWQTHSSQSSMLIGWICKFERVTPRLSNICTQTLDASILRKINQLHYNLFTASQHQPCRKEQTARRQSNPGSQVARLLWSRTTRNIPSNSLSHTQQLAPR